MRSFDTIRRGRRNKGDFYNSLSGAFRKHDTFVQFESAPNTGICNGGVLWGNQRCSSIPRNIHDGKDKPQQYFRLQIIHNTPLFFVLLIGFRNRTCDPESIIMPGTYTAQFIVFKL